MGNEEKRASNGGCFRSGWNCHFHYTLCDHFRRLHYSRKIDGFLPTSKSLRSSPSAASPCASQPSPPLTLPPHAAAVTTNFTTPHRSLAGMFLMFTGLYFVLWAKGNEVFDNYPNEYDVEKPLLS
ncbi:unnamed protein product [Cuscuta europaea]|uniref:Uncharacterized protein n=1 Tax=Cuscuta europaea TaxID=41803 RepID=A0A9P1A383_CUSEU|nr:unnamed protein product [Cuscuta europaea]